MPVREIEYKIDGESMKFVLQPVQVDFTGTKVVNYTVTYRLYVAFKREHINLFAKCSIGTIYQREIVEAGTVPIVFDIKVQYMIA